MQSHAGLPGARFEVAPEGTEAYTAPEHLAVLEPTLPYRLVNVRGKSAQLAPLSTAKQQLSSKSDLTGRRRSLLPE